MNELKYVTAPATKPLTAEAFGPSDKTTVYWLGGAGFLINARGTIIMIDPVLKTLPGQPGISENDLKMKVNLPIDAADVPKLDFLLYTHSDDDHLALATAKELIKLKPAIIGPTPVYRILTGIGVDPGSIKVCRSDDTFPAGSATIEVTPADHPWQLLDVEKYGKPFRPDDCVGFILNAPDGRFYLPGDTRLMEEHLKIKDIDILALDVSVCTYHLNHYGAIAMANSLSNALLIPYHYGTYDVPGHLAYCGDPNDVLNVAKQGQARGRVYAPGQPLSLKDGREAAE